jgi:hypothetical protein
MAAFTDGRIVTASEILEHRTDLVSNPTTGALLGDNFLLHRQYGNLQP